MGESTKILLQDPIHNFGLVVSFWMVCRTHTQAGATEAKKFLPKRADEYRVAVRHDALGKTMMLIDDIHK